MRRKAGIAAIQQKKVEGEKFKEKGAVIQENQLENMTKRLEVFKKNLETFAAKHKEEIKKNPHFRKQFQEMCASIGVDPLASSKGFWSEMLGVGDFYYEIAVQAVEVCIATQQRNGGLVELDELRKRLVGARGRAVHHQEISNDDILRAIKKMNVLRSGFSVIPLDGQRGRYLVRSIPGELSLDHTVVLQQAKNSGFSSVNGLVTELGWNPVRAEKVLNELLRDGVAWIDTQGGDTKFWFPVLLKPF
nr:EOG090X09XM [Artemia franciscana]